MSPRLDELSDGVETADPVPRIACLLVSDLPLRAELRAHPELAERAFVIASGSDGRAEVVGVSPAAFRAGVRLRCSVAQARALHSDLRLRIASPALDRATRQTLLDVALSFSPRAVTAPCSNGAFAEEAAVFLDASGITRLFESERHFASAIAARAEALGLPAAVAVASSRSVARIAARQCALRSDTDPPHEAEGVICVLPPGSEARFLGPLSIDLLDPEDGLAEQLTRFGVHTVRDLLHLPRRALAKRLGPDVLALIALARGEETLPPICAASDARLEEAVDLEYPVDRLEPLLFAMRGLLSRLLERLALRRLACVTLDLQLELDGGGRDVRQVGVSTATRDIRVLLRLLGLTLETRPPLAPVATISLATRGRPARCDQLDLFRPHGPDPNALDRTLSELESLCGVGRVGAPVVADDHRPDGFRIKPFEICSAAKHSAEDSDGGIADPHSPPAIRALRPAVDAEVRITCGLPTSLRSAVASGEILHISGPWRTTGRWWSESERYAMDHFDVQVSDGSVLRLCFDWIRRAWRIDGIYD
jgi:protein ImuB